VRGGTDKAGAELAPFIQAEDDHGFFTHLGMGILAWHLTTTILPPAHVQQSGEA
jgi:hypothetical protein